MGSTRKYVVIDPATGKLDRRVFSEQAIYDDEMEKIFGRAWLMIGHESLVPAADDFFHTYMGEDPVILTRDGRGLLHGLLRSLRPGFELTSQQRGAGIARRGSHRTNGGLRCEAGQELGRRGCMTGLRPSRRAFWALLRMRVKL